MDKQISIVMGLKNGVSKPLSQMHQSTQQVTKGFDVLQGKMKMLKGAIGGLMAGFAIGKVIDVGKELMDAYAIQRKAEQSVNDSIYSNMKARGESQVAIDKEVNAYKDLASQLQSVGVIGDEVTLSGMAVATQMGLTTNQVKEMTPLIQDLAVKQDGLNVTQESFTETFKNVTTMVNMGKLGLQKYGIEVTDVEKKAFKSMNAQDRYAFIMNKLKNSVAGANKALAQTPDGKLARINNEIGDIKEQLGQQIDIALEPMLEPILNLMKWLNGDFQNQLANVKQMFIDFYDDNEQYFAVFGDIARVWVSIWKGLEPQLKPILEGLKGVIEGVFKTIMSLLKFDLKGAWDGLTETVGGACKAILEFVTGLSRGVINAFAEMIGYGEQWRAEQERLRAQAQLAQRPNMGINTDLSGSVGGAKHNALGTSYFKGGWTHINENNRGEIVNLPNGSQIIPHDVANNLGGNNVNVNVNVQGNVIGNEEYINELGNSLVQRLQLAMSNM